jgi:hypothetical protein
VSDDKVSRTAAINVAESVRVQLFETATWENANSIYAVPPVGEYQSGRGAGWVA